MTNSLLRYVLVALALSTSLLQPAAYGDNQDDVEAIKTAFAEWVAVAEAGDADAYSNFITDEAVYLGPGGPAVVGKEAIHAFVAEFLDGWNFSFPTWTTDEVIVSGDLAVHRYSGVAILSPKEGGEVVELDRKYMDVLRRQADGRWLVARHMFNMNE